MAIAGERKAKISLGVDSRRLGPELAAAQSKLRNFKRTASKAMFGGPSAVANGIARIGVGAMESIGASAVSALSAGAEEAVDFERSMTRFQIASGRSEQQINSFRMQLGAMSREFGLNRTQLLAGASSYVALTGDAAGATDGVRTFARVAVASGATMADVATAAAAFKTNLKINPADFEAAFSSLIAQGKAGSVELRDLASELSGIAPTFTQFKGASGIKGLVDLGAALQVVKTGTGTASEAATYLGALVTSLNRNARLFSSVKVGGSYGLFQKDPKTGVSTLKDFRSIIDGIANSRLAKDPTLLTKAFGSDEARRAFQALSQNRDMLTQLQAEFSNTGVVAADSLKYLESPAGKIDRAMQEVKAAVAQAFTPERIKAFATALEGVARLFNNIVQAVTSISEFSEVREKKQRNDHETAMLGSYTGDDRYLQGVSANRARVLEQQGAALRERSALERARRVAVETGPGLLSLSPPHSTADDRQRSRSLLEPTAPAPAQLVSAVPSAQSRPATSGLSSADRALLTAIAKRPDVKVQIGSDSVAKAVAAAPGARRNVGGAGVR